jgi:hypothetical protein
VNPMIPENAAEERSRASSLGTTFLVSGLILGLVALLLLGALYPTVTCPECDGRVFFPSNDGAPGLEQCGTCRWGKVSRWKRWWYLRKQPSP